MDIVNLIARQKDKLLNILVVIVALFVAKNIYQAQAKKIVLINQSKDAQVKKNEILTTIMVLEKKINSLKAAVNNQQDEPLVIDALGNTAKEAAVKIVSLNPQAEQSLPEYTRHSFGLVISAADYHGIGRFVSKIESSDDVYIVDNINIKPVSAGSQAYAMPETEVQASKDELRAELTVSTLRLKE